MTSQKLALVTLILLSSLCPALADNPVEVPFDTSISGSLWWSDPRWEVDTPDVQFGWTSVSEGIFVTTTCFARFRRAVEDAHALILFGCDGFNETAILWIFFDDYRVMYGFYPDSGGIINALQDANFQLAYGANVPSGKLAVWDGKFEVNQIGGLSKNRSWGDIKYIQSIKR